MPAGTRLKVTGWYDNSKENPANPDPSKTVRFGEQTWDEMMIGYFTGHVHEVTNAAVERQAWGGLFERNARREYAGHDAKIARPSPYDRRRDRAF